MNLLGKIWLVPLLIQHTKINFGWIKGQMQTLQSWKARENCRWTLLRESTGRKFQRRKMTDSIKLTFIALKKLP